MKKITARILALLLVALMACTMLPTFAMAAEEPVVPKDPKTSEPGMIKDSDVDSMKPGETVTYTLTSNVPGYLGEFLQPDDPKDPIIVTNALEGRGSYEIVFHDNMAAALTFNNDVAVTVNGKALDAELFTVTTETGDGCTFHVSMDLVAIYNAKNADETRKYFTFEEIAQAPEIVITYSATMKDGTTAGTYPNAAFASYKAKDGTDTQSAESIKNVDVYAIKVYKYDQANEAKAPLKDATFELKLKTTTAEGETTETLVATLKSGEDGYVTFDGLKAGTYTLTEKKAPEGYIKSDKALEITLPCEKMTNNTVMTEFANAKIPHTGGEGTAMFVTMGIVLMGAAAVLFLASQKKRFMA